MTNSNIVLSPEGKARCSGTLVGQPAQQAAIQRKRIAPLAPHVTTEGCTLHTAKKTLHVLKGLVTTLTKQHTLNRPRPPMPKIASTTVKSVRAPATQSKWIKKYYEETRPQQSTIGIDVK